jgi:hypothetical protein
MDELPPKAAALLRAARRDHNPTRADSERVRTALAAALLAPPVSDLPNEATNAGVNAAGAGKSASGLLSASWIKGVAMLGVVGSASLWAYLEGAPEPAHAPSGQSSASAAREVARSEVAPAHEQRAAPAPAPATSEQSALHAAGAPASSAPSGAAAQAEEAPPARAARARRASARAPKATEPADTTRAIASAQSSEAAGEAELSLMRRAIAQLNAGAPRSALELLSQHAARYPNGVMSEERDGLRAIALCKEGDLVQGKASALSFLRMYAGSAMAGRVRGACKESGQ